MYKITTDDVEGQAPEIVQSVDELAREGARQMILAALELEVDWNTVSHLQTAASWPIIRGESWRNLLPYLGHTR